MKQGCGNINNAEKENDEMIRSTAYRAALRRGSKIENGSKVYDQEREDRKSTRLNSSHP